MKSSDKPPVAWSLQSRNLIIAWLANMTSKYKDIIFEVKDRIGIIKVRLLNPHLPAQEWGWFDMQFNRPKSLNAFGGKIISETLSAIRELNEHPDTVFTVLTGEGRFFSAGADVMGSLYLPSQRWHKTYIYAQEVSSLTATKYDSVVEKKLAYLAGFMPGKNLASS